MTQGASVEDIKSKIVGAEPQTNGTTQPDYVKFHDDKVGRPSVLPV